MNGVRLVLVLRIAATAVCAAGCLLLSVLWARSYEWSDRLIGPLPRSHMFQAYTWCGTFHAVVSGPAYRLDLWERYSSPIPQQSDTPNAGAQSSGFLNFSFREIQGIVHATAPMWFLVALSVALPTAVWIDRIRWRFSLRTLLVATTLVAIALGVVAAMRSQLVK